MYRYIWDNETGGVILLTVKNKSYKEIRPVFYEELILLKMDKYFKFEYNENPYMWNDGHQYIYYGNVLFKFRKTIDVFQDDEIEYIDENMIGKTILPINVNRMIEKNERVLNILENNSLKIIYDTYDKFKNKTDIIVVNYSGGKDSIVTLDLVKRILNPKDFMVIYSDTGMEFDDSKKTIKREKNVCEQQNIRFLIAKAEKDTYDLWEVIGPPSRKNRWCCSINKSTPVTLLLKKITRKKDARVLSFQGNRALECSGRSKLSLIIYGQKYSNRIACNAILDWSSLEVFLYIFRRKLELNNCYKNGLKRIGCILCPMCTAEVARPSYRAYKEEMDKWYDVIMYAYNINDKNIERKKYFINNHMWSERDGSYGTIYQNGYKEYINNEFLCIEYENTNDSWKEWIKTLGDIKEDKNLYIINFRGKIYKFTVTNDNKKINIKLLDKINDDNAEFVNLFKIVFRKSSFCIGCHTCEIECVNGAIEMEGNKIRIKNNCKHCCNCHKNEHICFAYLSKYNKEEVIV